VASLVISFSSYRVRSTISVHRARSDRHTFVECSELDPTYNPRRNRDRNVDPASEIHEHRSCDRDQSITFWAAATVEKRSIGEQFTYGTSREGM